jgi:sensor histidine kinase YesM
MLMWMAFPQTSIHNLHSQNRLAGPSSSDPAYTRMRGHYRDKEYRSSYHSFYSELRLEYRRDQLVMMCGSIFLTKGIFSSNLLSIYSINFDRHSCSMEKFWKYKLDHVIFWVITIGFHIYTRIGLLEMAGPFQFFLEIIVRNGLLAIIIYVNLKFFIPYFAQRQQVILYILGLIASLSFYILVKNGHDLYLSQFVKKASLPFWKYSFYNFSIALFYMSFSLALEFSKEWYFQRERLRQVEVEKLNTELDYLKSQINPHFLFNSINTIYFQIDKANVPAREALSTFSDMLRYQLYECNEKEIPVEKEIAYLKNYMALQRMRKDENYSIAFTHEDTVRNFRIAPLLMITFIENAFKHVSTYPDKVNKIAVDLRRSNGSFILQVSNTKDALHVDNKHNGGIGLKNVRRRLDLLYKDKHDLKITETDHDFVINLSIAIDGKP